MTRERLAEMVQRGLVTPTGLISHGRGEAFDYLMGERSTDAALQAEKAAAAYLLSADNPVICVNGNAAANGAELYLGGIAGDARRLNIGASSSASSTGDIYTSVAGGSVTAATGEFSATVYIGGIAGRMSYMRSERTAADVAVTVTGSAASVRAGAHTGGILNTVTYSKAYYAKEATVTVNGETATSPSLSGVSETERANFKDTDWLTGNDKLNLDHAVWTATEDGPRLVLETEEN